MATNHRNGAHRYWVEALAMGVGVGLGAAAMYFFDPNRGQPRRTRVKARTEDALRQARREVAEKAGEAWDRARLAVEEVR